MDKLQLRVWLYHISWVSPAQPVADISSKITSKSPCPRRTWFNCAHFNSLNNSYQTHSLTSFKTKERICLFWHQLTQSQKELQCLQNNQFLVLCGLGPFLMTDCCGIYICTEATPVGMISPGHISAQITSSLGKGPNSNMETWGPWMIPNFLWNVTLRQFTQNLHAK